MSQQEVEDKMLAIGEQIKDAGTILTGEQAVECGLINQLGGIKDAFQKITELCGF